MSKAGSISQHRQGLWRGIAITLFLTAAGASAAGAGPIELISQADPLPDS